MIRPRDAVVQVMAADTRAGCGRGGRGAIAKSSAADSSERSAAEADRQVVREGLGGAFIIREATVSRASLREPGQDLNLRPPGYEPPRLVSPCAAVFA